MENIQIRLSEPDCFGFQRISLLLLTSPGSCRVFSKDLSSLFFSKAVQLSNYSSVGMSNGMVVVCDVCDICDEEGQRLFAKRAITEIKDNSLSLFVTFSVSLKKKGSGHFIVNLKSLNSFIRYKHKIENLDLLRFIVREDD